MERLYNGANLGAFRILHQIGEGGMAKVYKAFQPSMERYVALKILPSQLAEDPLFVERFIREARTIAQLEHKNILPVYDFGEQNGITYLAMRFVEGGTLKELLSKGRLPLHDILDLMAQVCPALDYAHRRGIIHRDVKPSNVILDTEGAAYLTDFGIAKVVGVSGDLTATGAAIGTPAYMAPEQAMGSSVDARTDIYALGILLYEMIVGRVPFKADTPMAVLMAHMHEPLPLPSQIDPSISHAVEAVIIKSLAKNPDDRYQTANDLVASFRSAVGTSAPHGETSTLITLIQEVYSSRTIPSAPEPISDPRLHQRMEQDYIDGLSAYWIRDWEKARVCFEAVLEINPNYKDTVSRLNEIEKQLNLSDLYLKAQDEIQKSDWTAAQKILERILSMDEDYQDAPALLQDSKRQIELADLYNQAEELSNAHQWQAVHQIFERVHQLDPNYPDPQDLQAKANAGILEQERTEKIKATYELGLQALDQGNWTQAQELFEQVQAKQPGFGYTEQLLQRTLDELEKSRQITAGPTEEFISQEATFVETSDQTVAAPPKLDHTPSKRLKIKPIWALVAVIGVILLAGIITTAVYLAGRLGAAVAKSTQETSSLAQSEPEEKSSPVSQSQPEHLSSHQHGPMEELVDNFDNTPDGFLNEDIWMLGDNCAAFDDFGRLLQDGVLRFLNYTSEDILRCQLWMFQGDRYPGGSLFPFEARLQVANAPVPGDSSLWLAVLADYDGSSLQAVCGLQTIENRVYQLFRVWENKNGIENELAVFQYPVEYKRWFTTRLQINPQTLAFECIFEDQLFADYKFPDEQLVREIPFARLIETQRMSNVVVRSLVDDVYFYPSQEALAQPQPEGSNPCEGDYTGWQAVYWDNPELAGEPVRCQDIPEINFRWEEGSPFPQDFPADNFSIRFSRILEFNPGKYGFLLSGDDGVRLWIDGEIAIDRWFPQAAREYRTVREFEGPHEFVIEYFEFESNASISFSFFPLPIMESCLPPPDGIVFWADGDRLVPLVGQTELIPHNDVGQDPAIVNSGFRFNPAGWEEESAGFIDIPLTPELAELQQFTVETWLFLNPDSPFQYEYYEEFVVMPDKFLFRKDPFGMLHFWVTVNGQEHEIFSSVGPPRDQWVHVAASYDGNAIRLYMNSRLVAEKPVQGELAPAKHLWLSHPIEPLDGMLDETSIYTRALSEEEIILINAAFRNGKCKP